MKKAIYTIGLFSLVMILTSFTKPEKKTTIKVSDLKLERRGSASPTVKLDDPK